MSEPTKERPYKVEATALLLMLVGTPQERWVGIFEGFLAKAADTMRAERDEARDWVRRLNKANTLTCVYCGHEYPPGTPAHGADALTDHIKTCSMHPLRAAEVKIDGLEKQLEQKASGTCGLCLAAINGAPTAQTQQGLSEGVAWSISGGGHDKRSVEIVTPDGDVVAEVFGSPAHLETAQQRAEAICAARRAAPEKELERSEEGGARSRGEVAAAFFDTIKHALACLDAPKTGMHVPYRGDFASALPSVQQTLRWWLREWESAPSNLEKQPSPAAAPAQLSEALRAALAEVKRMTSVGPPVPPGRKPVPGEGWYNLVLRVNAFAAAALAGQPAPTAPTGQTTGDIEPHLRTDEEKRVLVQRFEILQDRLCQTQGMILHALKEAGLTVVPLNPSAREIAPTEDREALRAAALEEAAKIADRDCRHSGPHACTANMIACSIRRLASSPAQPERDGAK